MATRTRSVYEELTKKMDKIAGKIHQIGEDNDLLDLSLLSSQLKGMKEDLARLLWVELPELNDKAKYEKLFNRSTGIFFNPGIFEIDAMRQAFFKRQAKTFFETEAEQQAYITYTEEQYLGATLNLKEIYFKANQTQPKLSYKEKKIQVQAEFMEAMQ